MENNQGTSCPTSFCNASVLKAHTLEQAENWPVRPGKYKVPVVLSEFVIQIDVEAKVKLNEPAYEIKRIEKQVFLTECRYVGGTDKVFIEGYIRKNIEYASRHCTTKSGIGGVINDTTVHIPFRCVTRVEFNGARPRVFPNFQPDVARYFDQKRMGKNIREADRASYEIFNEPVYCELEWSEIYDADIDDRGCPIDHFLNEEEFQEFTDKSVVYIAIKLLQKQQVGHTHHGHYDEKEGFEKEGYEKEGFENQGFENKGCGKEGFSKEGFKKEEFEKEYGYKGKGEWNGMIDKYKK
ncbi:hypothetical protein NL50_09710 [Clostridium acetobutylicum]|nr:hypothetical protein NL50_09710 [Clostridium acetobutylicum]